MNALSRMQRLKPQSRAQHDPREQNRSTLRLPHRLHGRLRNRHVGAVMTSQQFADELLHHWRLLWPLPAAERIKRIDEIRADMEFEEQLSAVSVEMEAA